MVDQNMDEDSQSALPGEENISKLDGSEKESTQVHQTFAYTLLRLASMKECNWPMKHH